MEFYVEPAVFPGELVVTNRDHRHVDLSTDAFWALLAELAALVQTVETGKPAAA